MMPVKRSLSLLVLGPTGVGKRTIVQEFLKTRPLVPGSNRMPFLKEENICDYKEENLQLTVSTLDTFKGMLASMVIRKMIAASDGFILVYSAEDEKSFEDLFSVRNIILEEKKDAPLFVVGHREDKGQIVWLSEKQDFVFWEWETDYREVLGNNPQHINSLFEKVIKKCLVVYKDTLPVVPRENRTFGDWIRRAMVGLSCIRGFQDYNDQKLGFIVNIGGLQ